MRTIVDQAFRATILLGLITAAPALASEPAPTPQDGRLAASRELAAALQGELGSRLQAALAEGGPVGAINVCRTAAPGIATRLSERSGAQVGRTALRIRNPANAPDPGERAVLEGFAQRFAAGLQAGIVWVNCWLLRDLRTPFGGVKQSGVGREGGWEAIRFFTETKSVTIAG